MPRLNRESKVARPEGLLWTKLVNWWESSPIVGALLGEMFSMDKSRVRTVPCPSGYGTRSTELSGAMTSSRQAQVDCSSIASAKRSIPTEVPQSRFLGAFVGAT